ncbi:hypothetical protein LOK49_LG02G03706 [Camellia lanceoleosa]|uniref:Uncharacterized protein n=1 Tax=Camellia lanceoleosa TaxID=1840588 RepID=A0ACC0ILS2_9ERIC|nr:hypothetical protein LOK49_LG02G03706 [Camellia lanceoleosa]
MDACSVAAFQEVVSAVRPPQTASLGTPTGHFAVYETPTLFFRTPTSRPSMVSRIRLTPSFKSPEKSTTTVLIWVFPNLAPIDSETSLSFSGFRPTRIKFRPLCS